MTRRAVPYVSAIIPECKPQKTEKSAEMVIKSIQLYRWGGDPIRIEIACRKEVFCDLLALGIGHSIDDISRMIRLRTAPED